MSFAPIGPAGKADAFATLVLAFASDPVERFLYPDAQSYVRRFPDFLAAFGGEAFEHQTAWALGPGAVALWLPPGVEADGGAVVDVLRATVSEDRHDDVFSVLDQMGELHPTYPHWYLPWLGVDPAAQSAGLGGRLLTACLEVVDASHLPAYLETPNPRNIGFYERHGFVTAGVAQAGRCPPVTSMVRAHPVTAS